MAARQPHRDEDRDRERQNGDREEVSKDHGIRRAW